MRSGPTTLTAENQDRLKCQLKQISYGYIYSYDFTKQKHILRKEEWEALTDYYSGKAARVKFSVAFFFVIFRVAMHACVVPA